jgi:hypothetical protein
MSKKSASPPLQVNQFANYQTTPGNAGLECDIAIATNTAYRGHCHA